MEASRKEPGRAHDRCFPARVQPLAAPPVRSADLAKDYSPAQVQGSRSLHLRSTRLAVHHVVRRATAPCAAPRPARVRDRVPDRHAPLDQPRHCLRARSSRLRTLHPPHQIRRAPPASTDAGAFARPHCTLVLHVLDVSMLQRFASLSLSLPLPLSSSDE